MPHSAVHVDGGMLAAVGLVVSGFLSRYLASTQPFRLRFFVGELIASILIGIAIYTLTDIRHLGPGVMVFLCIFTGLGVTRTLEWVVKLLNAVKNIG